MGPFQRSLRGTLFNLICLCILSSLFGASASPAHSRQAASIQKIFKLDQTCTNLLFPSGGPNNINKEASIPSKCKTKHPIPKGTIGDEDKPYLIADLKKDNPLLQDWEKVKFTGEIICSTTEASPSVEEVRKLALPSSRVKCEAMHMQFLNALRNGGSGNESDRCVELEEGGTSRAKSKLCIPTVSYFRKMVVDKGYKEISKVSDCPTLGVLALVMVDFCAVDGKVAGTFRWGRWRSENYGEPPAVLTWAYDLTIDEQSVKAI
ncbi:hypothetical protein BJ508DRAFT_323205 [Ascobolus immersus RN42]|uniref:Uncharacterized protein n=1 Tax=Ascobolus immersus RN42 TaxID=1160509 RepID=A0A3N4IJZ9_ASCIM|nr:hypothetical protein BJ508DRAFT_323205 [Ascobolus immersus RN42]